ncbi:hypothetical protein O3M35_001681 [Rhynocoris fuscipes]|uniref:Uncharacterized protein n=1 Tax=Rhynocoris fuscipes TaxID=488301 RepID=A0AAW1CQ00_9HEMI
MISISPSPVFLATSSIWLPTPYQVQVWLSWKSETAAGKIRDASVSWVRLFIFDLRTVHVGTSYRLDL